MSTVEIAQSLYDHIKKAVQDKKINADVILNITMLSIIFVETHKNLTGEQKKSLVLQAIRRLVDEAPLEPQTRSNLDLVVQLTLPGFIDGIIDASNGNLKLNGECLKGCRCDIM